MFKAAKSHWYLVFNNSYSGIIKSQVIDRIRFVQSESEERFIVIVIVSPRIWFCQMELFKSSSSTDVLVLPSIGSLRYWKLNVFVLYICSILYKPRSIICRSMFATSMGLALKRLGRVSHVVHDGRGAEFAEWSEYLSKDGSPFSLAYIKELERNAVLASDAQFSVSKELVKYWNEHYNYKGNPVVIPCTVNPASIDSQTGSSVSRDDIGFSQEDVVLLISLSKSDWQSLEGIEEGIRKLLDLNPSVKLLVLTNQDLPANWKNGYNSRIYKTWLRPNQVMAYYRLCDYGLLLREKSITNKVASPVKFAEYLYAGLRVLISPEIGDYSEMVSYYNLGHVVNSAKELTSLELNWSSEQERAYLHRFALDNLSFENRVDDFKGAII